MLRIEKDECALELDLEFNVAIQPLAADFTTKVVLDQETPNQQFFKILLI